MKIPSKKAAAPAKGVKSKTGLVALATYSIKHVNATLKAGLDGAGSWLGKQIKDKLVTALIVNQAKINSTRLARTDKVLFVSAPKKAYAWPLVGNSGDIYERAHDKGTVRGLVSSLKEAYGDKNVRLVGKQEAVKLLKSLNSEKDSLKALGIG